MSYTFAVFRQGFAVANILPLMENDFPRGVVLDPYRCKQSRPVQSCPVSIPEPAMLVWGKNGVCLLRIRDDHHDIGSCRSRGDGAILIEAKINVSQPGTDLVRGATAAEDRPAEIIFEDIARPVSRKRANREDVVAVTDPSRHVPSVIAGEARIEPLDPCPGDSG